ncbi:hypothetical protein L2750_19750 [Shewanella submarina]|uniref:Peptidase MA-like domain-containing protein n=1 Tax=Shewanella submarina TaxID=2016376 RepID=A0ABV7GB54_9GAMM|nr:hypothetical protein [Shewanella submarina]MCL1039361.1 hypothetical protein [Shewanella submarina]
MKVITTIVISAILTGCASSDISPPHPLGASSTSEPVLTRVDSAPGIVLWSDGVAAPENTLQLLIEARAKFSRQVVTPPDFNTLKVLNNEALIALSSELPGTANLTLTEEMFDGDEHRTATIVRHEACHIMAIEGWKAMGLGSQTDVGLSYGHPAVVDWLDETLAVMCEPEASRLDQPFTPIPMADYLTMEHPAFATIKAQLEAMRNSAGQGDSEDGSGPMVIVKDEPEESDLPGDYYTQSAWIRELILDQLGYEGIRQIYKSAAAGVNPSRVLMQKLGADSWQQMDTLFADYLARAGAPLR